MIRAEMVLKVKMVKIYFIFIFIIATVGCGKGFKSQKGASLDKPKEQVADQRLEPVEEGSKLVPFDFDNKKQVEAGEVREVKWTQEIPQKYDDVGDFYRIKEIPGLNENQEIDSLQQVNPDSKEIVKTVNLVRGKLKLSQVKHQFVSSNKELEVTGDVTFDDQKPLPFVLKGPVVDGEVTLEISEAKSNLKPVFKAKAVCLKQELLNDENAENETAENCDKLTLDFYYKSQNTFYTDQMISKEYLISEIKKPSEEVIVADEYFSGIPDEQLTDYEKRQKKGTEGALNKLNEEDIELIKDKELPSYFTKPSMADVAILYPEVRKIVEDNIAKTYKPKKKLKKLPELKGEEKIPEEVAPGKTVIQPQKDIPKKADEPGTKAPTPPGAPTVPVLTPAPLPAPTPKKPVEPKLPQPVQPKPEPKPKPQPEPQQPVKPAPIPEPTPKASPEENGLRPVDQAWGKPHLGQVLNGKRVYLTNSTSLLEVFQKLGPNLGFSLWSPQKLRHYGTYDIVELIVNLGEWVKENVPTFNLKVNDISAKNGGRIGHSSHKTGMDVDLAYVTKSPKMTFMDVDRVKGSFTHPDFDAANQWKMFKAAFEMAPIEVVYVNRKIKNEMCRQALIAKDLESNKDVKSEAASILTRLVVIDNNHGDHWHARMDCTALKSMKLQRKCISHPQPFVGPECQKITLK